MGDGKVINWTEPMLARFKVIHQKALRQNHDAFIFDGNKFNTAYAGYLITYLEEKFK